MALNIEHRDHLLKELGSPEAVSNAIAHGARSVTSEEAMKLGYRIRGTDDQIHYLPGLLLPFSGEFGQLRPDAPIIPKGGKKPAKYLSKAATKQTIATFGDGEPTIATEGWKDALAIHLNTGATVCGIAGVSAWKLLPPSVKLLIYDADAACKPGVWGALASAGLVRGNLKLAFFPVVKGDGTAGACEFFRHHDGEAFESIPRLTARELIHGICNSWSRDIRADLQTNNIRTLATTALRAGFDENTVNLLVEGAAKQNLRMRVELARNIIKKVVDYSRRQSIRKRKQERELSAIHAAGADGLAAAGEGDIGELATTFGHIVLNTLFGGGDGYASIGGALYRYAGDHHALVDRSALKKRLAKFASNYVVENRMGEETVPFATTHHVDEALEFLLCATGRSSEHFNPAGYVNCTNGVLKLSWGGSDGRTLQCDLIEHTPDLIFTSPPGCAFEPGANPAEFKRMMQCLTPDEGDMLIERMGASLDVLKVRKCHDRIPASFCIGDGSNGKDTTEICFARIIGQGAVSGARISDFKGYDTGGSGRFNLADLSTSRANIASENFAGVKIEHCESLKAAISGEMLMVEKKNVQSWAIWPKCVMFFNFNTHPILDGVTAAIGSRVDIFCFDQTYSSLPTLKSGELRADPRFKNDAEWVGANVLPAMLNAMLNGLQSVVNNGFSRAAGRAAMRRIQEASTHLVRMLEDLGLEPGTRHDRVGPRFGPKELWPLIQGWYLENGWATWWHDKNGHPTDQLAWTSTDRGADGDPPIKAPHRIVPMLKRVAPSIGTTGTGGGKTRIVGLKAMPGSSLALLDLVLLPDGDGSNSESGSPGDPLGDPNGQKQVTPDPFQQNQGDPSDPRNQLKRVSGLDAYAPSADVSPSPPIGGGEVGNRGHQGHLPSAAVDLGSPQGSPPGSPRVTGSPAKASNDNSTPSGNTPTNNNNGMSSNNQMEAISDDPRGQLLADMAALQPWQQRVIKLKVMDPAAVPAALINQIPVAELPGGTGAMVKAFLAEPNTIRLVAFLAEHRPQHGEAA